MITFIGVHIEKTSQGKDIRKYKTVTTDHFTFNLDLAKQWADQNIFKYLPKDIEWIVTLHHTVLDDFELKRKGIRFPKNKLRKFLDENYQKYLLLMNTCFKGGFDSEESKWKKQSKFYMDLFVKEYNIKPRCAAEYHVVFWNKIQNHIIQFMKLQEKNTTQSMQSNRGDEVEIGSMAEVFKKGN